MIIHDSLHSLLDYERLLFHCDECRTMNHCSHTEIPYEWITTLLQLSGGSNIGHHLKRFLCCLIRCHGNLCSETCYLATEVPLLTA
jgi:hypothetical protein